MKLIVVFILLCLPLLGFSQDEVNPGVDAATQDEAAIAEIEKAREERQKSMEAVAKVTAVSEKAFNPTEELKKLGYDQINPRALFNSQAILLIEKIFKEAKMHTLPPELLREKILDSFKGHPLEGFFRSSPGLVNFFVDLLRDEKALTSAIQIFKDKDRLKTYLYVWIVIMFLAYFTRKVFVSKYWGRWTRAFASFMFSITVSVISLSSFCLIFQEEMKPIINIVKRYI